MEMVMWVNLFMLHMDQITGMGMDSGMHRIRGMDSGMHRIRDIDRFRLTQIICSSMMRTLMPALSCEVKVFKQC
jgi:hypothetical protein